MMELKEAEEQHQIQGKLDGKTAQNFLFTEDYSWDYAASMIGEDFI